MVKVGTCKHKEFVEFIFLCVNCICGAGLYAGVYGVLVMHLSIPDAPLPPPPQLTPRALAFFVLGWQIPESGDEGRGQMPCPQDRTSASNTAAVFIHCTIVPLSVFKCMIFCLCKSASSSSNCLITQTTLHDS